MDEKRDVLTSATEVSSRRRAACHATNQQTIEWASNYSPMILKNFWVHALSSVMVQMRGLNASEKKQRILTMMDLLKHSE